MTSFMKTQYITNYKSLRLIMAFFLFNNTNDLTLELKAAPQFKCTCIIYSVAKHLKT